MAMTADATALQHIWICTQNVGLVRADQIVTLSVDDGRQRARDAEEVSEFGDDALTAALRNGQNGTAGVLRHSGGLAGHSGAGRDHRRRRPRGGQRRRPGQVRLPQATVDGRLAWTHSVGGIGTDTWPLGPTRTPRPPYEPPAEWPLLTLGTPSSSTEPAPGPRTSPTSRPDPPPTRTRA
jgi:hypothetical protein